MTKHVMERRAADNEYLHKDFHAALNRGLLYLEEHFGEAAVKEYLREFSRAWHAPLREAMLREGLGAVCRHIVEAHRREGVEVRVEEGEDGDVLLHIPECPAVQHIRKLGDEPSPLFVETTTSVYEALCEETPYEFELLAYDPATGKAKLHFFRTPDA